jgi:hypothetical protein
MGSRYPPAYYSEKTLKALEDAFLEVLATLAANDPHWIANNAGLRVAVIHRLLELVEDGFTDPEELRTLTLSHFTLSQEAKV